MIASDQNRAGGGNSSGIYLGCLLAVLLAGCSSPASVVEPASKAPTTAPVAQAAMAAAPTTSAVPAGDAERGQELYDARCGACHSIDANRVGPKHEGLFGRTAGKLKDFDYSSAVKASKIVWNEKTLDQWLTDPQALIPGQKMNYSVADGKDRADIIAYLKVATAK